MAAQADYHQTTGFPGGANGKESACNAGEPCWIPGWGGVPREGKLPTPVFLPGESHKRRIPLAVVLPRPARGAGTLIPSAQRLVWAPPDRDRRGDSPAWSGRGSRPSTATPVHRPQRPAGSTHSSTRGPRPPEQLERPAGLSGIPRYGRSQPPYREEAQVGPGEELSPPTNGHKREPAWKWLL